MEPEVPAPWEPRPKARLGVRGLVGGVGALKVPILRKAVNQRVSGVFIVGILGGKILEAIVTKRADPQSHSGKAVSGFVVIAAVRRSNIVAVGISGHAAVLLFKGNLRLGVQVDVAEHQIEERVVLRGGGRGFAVVVVALKRQMPFVDGVSDSTVEDRYSTDVVSGAIGENRIGVSDTVESDVSDDLQVVVAIAAGAFLVGVNHAYVPVHSAHPFLI